MLMAKKWLKQNFLAVMKSTLLKLNMKGKNGTPPYYQLPIINPNGR